MLPPGRARLVTSPEATGSAPPVKTIGIVLVACRAASSAPGAATMTSTFRSTSSAARSGRSSRFQAADRYSIMMVRPTT